MSVIFFMIGISLLMALGFLAAFIWSMRSGQQDDLYTPSMRMLLDDTTPYVSGAAPSALNQPIGLPPHQTADPSELPYSRLIEPSL